MDATSMESGVSTTTTNATGTDRLNMKHSVPTMVTIPPKSCVKPCSRPSPTWSASLTTRDRRSPCACESKNEKGSIKNASHASFRRSHTVL